MMSVATLAEALTNIAPSATEPEAITALVDAYSLFAQEALANSPLLPAGLALGKSAMAATLVGMSVDGAALPKIPAALVAFWAAVAAGLTTSFAGATAIVAPPHTSFAAQFATAVNSNVVNGKNAEDSSMEIAQIMYDNATLGGIVTVGATATPIL